MAKTLVKNVTVWGASGPVTYGPAAGNQASVPNDIAAQITSATAWSLTAASQAEMLALSSATVDDVCLRTDTAPDSVYILTATPPATLANWTLLNPPSVADAQLDGVNLSTQAELDAAISGLAGTYAERVTTLTGVAIQAALDAAEDAGGGDVDLLPNATYVTLLPIYVWANTTLKMNGATIQADPAAVLLLDHPTTSWAVVVLRGATDVTIEGGTVDVNNVTNSMGIASSCDGDATITATRHTVRRCRVINSTNTALRGYSPSLDLTWEDNVIEDCTWGLFTKADAPGWTKGTRILRNRLRRVATVNIQVYSEVLSGHADVLVADNDLRDFTTPATAIPIEVTGADRVRIRGNNVGSAATRGVSTANCNELDITSNTMVEQTKYAVEIGGSNNVRVTGNLARDCASLVQETLSACTDVLVADNIFVGSDLAAVPSSPSPAAVIFAYATKRVRVKGNIFTNWQYLTQGCIRLGSFGTVEDAVVEGNTFVATDANTPLLAVSLRKAVRSSVVRNTIRIERDLVAADDYSPVISLSIDAASADLLIDGNDILFAGAVVDAPNAAGISNGNVAAGALPGVIIRRNKITRGPRGLRLMVNSADLVVADNDTATNTNPDVPLTPFVPNPGAIGDEYLLTAGGEAALLRPFGCTADNAASASGTVVLSYFTAKRTETITQVRMRTGATPAAATPTLCRIGIWSVDTNGNLVALLASTPNDTALFAAATTTYTKTLSAPWAKVAGTRYAIGYLVVSAAACPSIVGGTQAAGGAAGQAAAGVAPRISALVPAQADLPASQFGLSNSSRMIQFEVMT